MTSTPEPPFLVVRPGVSFWIEHRPPGDLRAVVQALREGCFDDAYCYDGSGNAWRIRGFTRRSGNLMRGWLGLPIPIRLELSSPQALELDNVVRDCEAILKSDTATVDYLYEAGDGPEPILKRLPTCHSAEALVEMLKEERERLQW